MDKTGARRLLICIIISGILASGGRVYGITQNFKYVIDTIGIPQYNVYGKEINEEVYNAYNVFSYGWPEELTSSVGQRWKNSKYGLWSKGQGAYKGSGIRGEYNLLGRDYSGNIINNYYFPVDMLPENTPEHWDYCSNPGAEDSWKDKNKYKYVEQLEYMKNTKLIFNDISSRDNSDNPEKMKEYNITSKNIGLDKARLDVCSTWKTNGIVHARRKVGGKIRYVVFLTKPMAASADVKSILDLKKDYVLSSNQQEIEISFSYGSNIVNMTGYAKQEHIKKIESKLYINGKEVDCISGSKTDSVGKKYTLKLSREQFIENTNNEIIVSVKSSAHTQFAVDGLMQHEVEEKINVFAEKKNIIPIISSEVKILEKENDALVVRPLAQSQITIKEESLGITEAGRNIVLKLNLNGKIRNKLKDTVVELDEEKISKINLIESENNILAIEFKIPIYTPASLYGWKSLRELYGNYFEINEQDIGKRISEPHNVDVKLMYDNKEHIVSLKLDTIDDYITNINYTYNAGMGACDVMKLEDWIG